MIVTNDFVYFHKGKTGGDKFYSLMNSNTCFTESIVYQNYNPGKYGRNNNWQKHNSIFDLLRLGYDIDTLRCFLGFRKLSSWLLSFANHHFYNNFKYDCAIEHINKKLNKGLIIKHNDPSLLKELNIYDDWNWIYADTIWHVLTQLTNKPTFIRQEYLLEDFNQKIAIPYYNVKLSNGYNNLINAFDKSDSPFKINDIETIYRNNPKWSDIEKELYNDENS